MKRARLFVFILLVLAQLLVVGNMARTSEIVLREGTEVVLATVPVDPRDLFRGDYVVLRYQIETLSRNEVRWFAYDPPIVGDQVWVLLEHRDGYHVPIAVRGSPAQPGEVAIRGTILRDGGSRVVIDYDINEYFVPEGTGRQVELAWQVDVVVAVHADGRAVIDHLIVDGSRWEPGD